MGGQRHAPAALPPAMRPATNCVVGRMGPRTILDWSLKISPPPGFDLRTVCLCEFACLWSRRLFVETKNLLFVQIFKRKYANLRALILYIPLFKIVQRRCFILQTNNFFLEFCQYTILKSVFYGEQTFVKLRPYISVIWAL